MSEPQAASQIVMQFDQLPPSQNQLLRMHWRRRTVALDAWIFWMKAQAQEQNLSSEAPAWHIAVGCLFKVARLMDEDNAQARFKLIGDALVRAGLVVDDNPNALQLAVFQRKVARAEQGVELTLNIVEPGDEYSLAEWSEQQLRQQAGVRKRRAQRGW